MAILQLKPHLTVAQLKERMEKERQVRAFKRWQVLYCVAMQSGIKAEEVALALGSSTSIVRRTVQAYNKQGAAFMEQARWGGRREPRCFISFEQEGQLLQSWEASALQGEVLVAKQLRDVVEQKVGHPVSDDYLWDLLHRHGWSKKAPRPRHPRAEGIREQREAFKKKHPSSSVPMPERHLP
jgi:transposase